MHDTQKRSQAWIIILAVIACLLAALVIVIFFTRQQNSVNHPPTASPFTLHTGVEYVPDRLLIVYKEGYSPDSLKDQPIKKEIDEVFKRAGVASQEPLFTSKDPVLKRHYVLSFKKGTDLQAAGQIIQGLEAVETIDADYLMSVEAIPNDTYYQQYQWNLKKVNAEQAWNSTKGTKGITVAVIDTGIDYEHEDIPVNIVKGPDYVNGDTDPMDDHGHGTHVAGIIGAQSNNAKGISGVNWEVTLLAIKAMNSSGFGQTSFLAQGIQYAADNGARVINMSFGSNLPCSLAGMQSVITYATQRNIVVVAAAGNDNVDASGVSPANCNNVLTVGASDANDERAIFSNYGSVVDIAAPGVAIVSAKSRVCHPRFCEGTSSGNYLNVSGTSMAAPHVSGVAALLLAANRSLSTNDISNCILQSADAITTDRAIGGKRLNAQKAMQACAGSTLIPTPVSGTSLQLTLKLHGIGRGGDNVNPNGLGNSNPLHADRSVVVTFANAQSQQIPQALGTVTYDAVSGAFKGTIALGSLPSGFYSLKIKVPQYLPKTISGIVTIRQGQANPVDTIALTSGDSNQDNKIDVLDFMIISDCFAELSVPRNCADADKKHMADLTDDGSVNQFDYNLLLRELSVQAGE